MLSTSFTGSDGYQENTDYTNSKVFLHSTAENEYILSELMVGWYQKKFGANAFYTPRFPEQYEESKSLFTALKFNIRKPVLKLSGNIYWKRHFDHFLLFRNNPAAYENYHMTDAIGGALSKKFRSSISITSLELKYRYEKIFSTTLGNIIDNPKVVKGTETYYNHFKERNHLSISADHLVQFRKIYINMGLLIQAGIENLSSPGMYPGIDLSYIVTDEFSLFSSVNKSMRLPTFTDLYYNGPQNKGNPNLLSETALTFETGAKYKSEGIRIDAALFYRLGKETIDWIWIDNIWQTKNLTDLDTYGAETSIYLFPSKFNNSIKTLEWLRISYSYIELSKLSDGLISNYALDNLRHKFMLDIKLKLPLQTYIDAKISRQARNGSYLLYETPVSSPVSTSYDPFWLVDINVGIKVGKITFFIDATNLLNTSYRDLGSVIMPGRWIMAGVRYR